ncbi:Uncharacterised protein [Segatella copri]|nr:Uncharacterised protein [Segatella copri]
MPFTLSSFFALRIEERILFMPMLLNCSPVSSPSQLSSVRSSICPCSFITITALSFSAGLLLLDATIPMIQMNPRMVMISPKANSPTIVAATFLKKSFIILCQYFISETSK